MSRQARAVTDYRRSDGFPTGGPCSGSGDRASATMDGSGEACGARDWLGKTSEQPNAKGAACMTSITTVLLKGTRFEQD